MTGTNGHVDLLAEIAASPAGGPIGAFFDLDGTLVVGFTAGEPGRSGTKLEHVAIHLAPPR